MPPQSLRGYAALSASLLTYRDKWNAANATSAAETDTASCSINAGSALGSSTHTGPRSERCSTNHPGNTTTPRTAKCLPVDCSSKHSNQRAAPLTCWIGSRSGMRPATRSESPSTVTTAFGQGLLKVFVSIAYTPCGDITT